MRYLISLLLLSAVAYGQSDCFASYTWDFWHGCIGDIDADGDVDATDLNFVQNALGTTNIAFDLDGDGIVTQADVGIVQDSIGETCQWPPEHHAVLRFEADDEGADIWIDVPTDTEIVGLQAWVVTEPDRSGWIEPDPNVVEVDLCGSLGGPLYENGRIGFAFGRLFGPRWTGSVHLGRLHGALGDYVLLYRPAGPPARCAELPPDGGPVRGLRFLVVVNRNDPPPPNPGHLTPSRRINALNRPR